MRRLTKVLLSTAATLFGIGAILAAIGWAMGGQTTMEVNLAGHQMSVGITGFHTSDTAWNGKDREHIVIDDLAAFDSLDVNISMGDVNIVPSDHFGLDLSWYGKNYKLHYTDDNGRLKVWSTTTPNIGINLNFKYGGTVTVYIPAETKLKSAIVETALGDMDLNGFDTENLDVTASLGSVSMQNVTTLSGRMELSLGDLDMSAVSAHTLDLILSMGQLEAYELTTTQELTVENHMGDIAVYGSLAGQTKMDASMGDVTISTDLDKRDYGYDLETSMGSIYVDGDERDEAAKRDGEPHFITVSNSMGDINVNFD